ncbi:MAG: radical SAM protein [Chloroflexi bacterium]|nr:radical SAM protein [Chloroflexota bacterium]
MEYRPRLVSWNITGACALRCPHCYIDAGRRRSGELSTDEGLRLIAQMAEAGTELLILTGGEPLLRKDLPQLASHATAKGISVVLGTTGTLITPALARVLKESGVIAAGISIDSLEAAKHDAFRGAVGAWERAVQGLEACRGEGLDVLVHTTALKMNQREVPGLVQFAHEKGARAFHLFFLVCTGRGERLTDLSPQEYESLLSYILDAQERYPGMMVRARCAPYIRRLAYARDATLAWSAGCLAGTSYCRITPTGDVTPCPYLPTRAGNVREASFQQIWESSTALTGLRGPSLKLLGKCGECSYSQGESPVCIGCRARAYALTGELQAGDSWCLYQPQQGGQPGAGEAAQPPAAPRGFAPPENIAWTQEALERMSNVPFFIRGRVKESAEAYARKQGLTQITPQLLADLHARARRPAAPEAGPLP